MEVHILGLLIQIQDKGQQGNNKRQVSLDIGSSKSTRRPEAPSPDPANPHCSFTRRELATLHCGNKPMLSAQLSWSSDQKKAMPMEFKGWFISSAKYSLNQKSAIPRFRNYYKRSSSLPGSSDTIFDEYKVIVVTDFPLADILHNRDATRRISKWAVELGALEIKFQPKTAIKSQALVDFLAEWREKQILAPANRPEHWVMYFNGSLKLEGGGAGVSSYHQKENS